MGIVPRSHQSICKRIVKSRSFAAGEALFWRFGMAGGHSAFVVRNGTAALHYLLQLAASTMQPDLDRGEGHSQEIGDLRSSQGVGFVEQNYGAVFVWEKVQTALNACACFFPLRNFKGRGRLRDRRLNAIVDFFSVEGNQRLALAQPIEANVRGDAVEPATNGFGIAQRLTMTIGSEERILREVFRFCGTLYETENIAIDSIVVRLEEHSRVDGSTRRTHTTIQRPACTAIP